MSYLFIFIIINWIKSFILSMYTCIKCIHMHMYKSYLEKISITSATKNDPCRLGELYLWFWVDFDNFTSFFLPLCIVFSPITRVTSCQDTDFFSRCDIKIYVHKSTFISRHASISITHLFPHFLMKLSSSLQWLVDVIIGLCKMNKGRH